jgi:hypothetical protein
VAVRFALTLDFGVQAETAVALLKVTPSVLDVLLVAVKGTGPQVHADMGSEIATQRGEEDDAKKAPFREQIVARRMPGKTTCLTDLVERQQGSRGVTLLCRPRRLTRRQ